MERRNRCCIETCIGQYFDLAHKFPRSHEIAQCWLAAIDNSYLKSLDLKKLSENYQVCARHFRISDYKHPQSRSLNKLAVPSLNLKNLSQLHLARDSSTRKSGNVFVKKPIVQSTKINSMSSDEDAIKEECQEEEILELIEGAAMSPNGSENNQCDVIVEEKLFTVKATNIPTVFELTHPYYDKPFHFNAYWMRFSCECSECFDSQTERKKLNLVDIPRSIQPTAISQLGSLETLSLECTREDGHISSHNIDSLFRIRIPKESVHLRKIAFDSKGFKKLPQIEFSKLVCFDDKIKEAFKNLLQNGFVCITKIPSQNSSMAALATQRLFPNQEYINFETYNEIHSDICTNITCTNIDCGLKCFFSTQKSEIILVDGINAAEKLHKIDPPGFGTLVSTAVPLRMRNSNICHEKSVPIINLNDKSKEIKRIQLDTQIMGSLSSRPQLEIQNFYDSLELFMAIIRSNTNQIVVTLEPGTLIILDNWRVLHKLIGNIGMKQSYLNRNDFIGRARFLELL